MQPALTAIRPKHIPPARLYDAAEGLRNLTSAHRKHLHLCDLCKDILQTFVTKMIGQSAESEIDSRRFIA